jgi:hypothetical protein
MDIQQRTSGVPPSRLSGQLPTSQEGQTQGSISASSSRGNRRGNPLGSIQLPPSVQTSPSFEGHQVISPFSQYQQMTTSDPEVSLSPTYFESNDVPLKPIPTAKRIQQQNIVENTRSPKKKRGERKMSRLKEWSTTIDITTDIVSIIEHCLDGNANCMIRSETVTLDAHIYLLTYYSDFLIGYFRLEQYHRGNAIDILWTLFRMNHGMTPVELYTKVVTFHSEPNNIIQYIFGDSILDDNVFSNRINPKVDSINPVSLMRTIKTLGYNDKIPPYKFADNKWTDPYYRIGFYTNTKTKDEINQRYGFIAGMQFSSQDIIDELVSYRKRMVLYEKKEKVSLNKTNRELSKMLGNLRVYNSKIITGLYESIAAMEIITEGEWSFDITLVADKGIYQIDNGKDTIDMLNFNLTQGGIEGTNVAVKLLLGNAWRILDALVGHTDSFVKAVDILSKLTIALIRYDNSLPFIFEDDYFANVSVMDAPEDLVYGFLMSRFMK